MNNRLHITDQDIKVDTFIVPQDNGTTNIPDAGGLYNDILTFIMCHNQSIATTNKSPKFFDIYDAGTDANGNPTIGIMSSIGTGYNGNLGFTPNPPLLSITFEQGLEYPPLNGTYCAPTWLYGVQGDPLSDFHAYNEVEKKVNNQLTIDNWNQTNGSYVLTEVFTYNLGWGILESGYENLYQPLTDHFLSNYIYWDGWEYFCDLDIDGACSDELDPV